MIAEIIKIIINNPGIRFGITMDYTNWVAKLVGYTSNYNPSEDTITFKDDCYEDNMLGYTYTNKDIVRYEYNKRYNHLEIIETEFNSNFNA